MVLASVYCSAAPRATFIMPRVMMKDGTRQRSETSPLTSPQTMPTSTDTSTASSTATGVGIPWAVSSGPETTAHSAITEPTDRSIPPTRMTKVIPTASMVLRVISVAMLVRLSEVRNLGAVAVKMATSASRAMPMPPSPITWRARAGRVRGLRGSVAEAVIGCDRSSGRGPRWW